MWAVRRMDPMSLVAEHCADSGHTLAFPKKILGRGKDRVAREAIETWPTKTTSNNHFSPFWHPTKPSERCSAYVGHTGRKFGTRINKRTLAVHRRDLLSLVFAHAVDCDHRFNWDTTEVVAMANTKQAREFLEAWLSNSNSINRNVDLDAHDEGLRARLTDSR
ncbi:unnamed protein product [Schistocephalus solidus]|uniref:Core-binding (CB) domain-containing protein n=1 Tax=Schistocephalus solidus TaxID=70667 RepID=A0A183TNK3_SCHSO|nr:unnamed protein product [Schistocephalus solidus]